MLISGVMMAIGLGIVSFGSVPFLGTFIAMAFVVVITALITFVQWISDLPYAITRGFRIEIWEMLLLYIGIALLLWALLDKSRRVLYASLFTFFFFIGFQSFQAVRDEQTQEFLVLNNNDPTFFIRRGKAANLIVVSNKPDIESRSSFLKRSLDIYFGVDTKMHFIGKKRGVLRSHTADFSFELKAGMIQFAVNNESFAYIFSDYFRETDLAESKHIIAGSCVNLTNLEAILENRTLWTMKNQGALRLEL
jgi:hypothetical protein